MGRPLNKRLFGMGPGNQIQAIVKVGENLEITGAILRQRTTDSFLVRDASGNEGVCKLVDKDAGSLANDEMIILVKDDDGVDHPVVKLSAHRATLSNGTSTVWAFDDNNRDELAEMPTVLDGPLLSALTSTPADFTVTAPAAIAISATVTAPEVDFDYTWQMSDDDGETWTTVDDGTELGNNRGSDVVLDIDPTEESMNGNLYRVHVVNEYGEATSETVELVVADPQF